MADTSIPGAALQHTGTEPPTALAALDFGALLTHAHLHHYETHCAPQWASVRRAALGSLARSKSELVAGFGTDNGIDTLFDQVEQIYQWKQHLQDHSELATTAIARLLAVGSTILAAQ